MSNITHGARSPSRVATKARNHRRRFFHRGGLKAGDLDPVASELLRLWSFAAAQLELREAAGGEADRDYWTCFNACHRTLVRLEKRLGVLGLNVAAGTRIREELLAKYADVDDDEGLV